jgi:thymidylate kinase
MSHFSLIFYRKKHPGEKKQERDRIERAGIDLQTKVRNAYLELCNQFNERIVLIDGHDTIDNIHGTILTELRRRHLFE